MMRFWRLTLAGILVFGSAACARAASEDVADGQAERLVREMSDYLAAAQEFRFEADVSYDSVQWSGEKIEFGVVVEVSVRRPDRLRVNIDGDESQRQIFFDGSTLTMFDVAAGLFAVNDVPADIDAALDQVFEDFGLSVPIADFVYRDPYSSLMSSVEDGSVVGTRVIDGQSCHHLSFVQETIDWQIWIADGPVPLPRKLVITYKDEPGEPHYSARLSGWDLQAVTSESYFQFRPPFGASEIEFLPSADEGPGP